MRKTISKWQSISCRQPGTKYKPRSLAPDQALTRPGTRASLIADERLPAQWTRTHDGLRHRRSEDRERWSLRRLRPGDNRSSVARTRQHLRRSWAAWRSYGSREKVVPDTGTGELRVSLWHRERK